VYALLLRTNPRLSFRGSKSWVEKHIQIGVCPVNWCPIWLYVWYWL